ncbi:MAG TPA: AI-2E family transporter [Longimicrobiaceae bacterium]|nr:AI-2E family transporter [Longimicrobiaceae bacterium]
MTEIPQQPASPRGGEEAPAPLRPDLAAALTRAVLLAFALVVLLWLLLRVRSVLLFFALAAVLAISLNAPVAWLERRGWHRALATVATTLAVLAVLGLVGWLVVPPLVEQVTILVRNLPEIAAGLEARVSALLVEHPEVEARLRREVGGQLVAWGLGMLEGVWSYSLTLIGALLLALLLLSIVVYMVADPRPLLAGYVAAMPPHLRGPATRAFVRASESTVGWMEANVVLGTLKAVPAFLFLYFMGIPGALVWSVLAFFSTLVPRLGFYVMAVPPVLVALSISPAKAAWTALFFWAWSEVLGALIAPRVQGTSMNIHPVFLLFVTMGMAVAFGLVGVLIAAPTAGFLRAYYEEFYLARRPADPELARRVDAMLRRDAGAAG